MVSLASVYLMQDHPDLYDVDQALALAERACKATGYKDPTAMEILAAVYRVVEQYDDAVSTATIAMKLALEPKNQPLIRQVRKRLDLCKQLQAKNSE